MPEIAISPARGLLTLVTLAGDDPLPFDPRLILILRNPTEAAIGPRLVGTEDAPVEARGLGLIDTTDGYPVGSILPGKSRVVPLASITGWLRGDVTVVDGAGLAAALIPMEPPNPSGPAVDLLIHAVLTDSSGNILTDASGLPLIITIKLSEA